MAGIALPRPAPLRALSLELGGAVDPGVADRVVQRVRAPGPEGTAHDLVVLVSRSKVDLALGGDSVLLCDERLAPHVPPGRRWLHAHVWWVIARMLENPPSLGASAPERSGWVDTTARVDPTVRIEAGAIVYGDVEIGPHSRIGHHVVVHHNVRIGARVEIGASSVIGAPGFGWALGPDGNCFRVPQLGGVIIEDDVALGALCTVDSGTLGPTILRTGVRFDAQVHVGHNAEVGAHTWVAAQSGFGGSSRLGRDVRIGGQAGVRDHVEIGDGAVVAAKSGVIGNVQPGATVAGFPAVDRVRWLRAWARMLQRRVK